MPFWSIIGVSVLCVAYGSQGLVWEHLLTANAPPKRDAHTAVLDAQQWMWIFGGRNVYWERLNDLHDFDVENMANCYQQQSFLLRAADTQQSWMHSSGCGFLLALTTKR